MSISERLHCENTSVTQSFAWWPTAGFFLFFLFFFRIQKFQQLAAGLEAGITAIPLGAWALPCEEGKREFRCSKPALSMFQVS